MSERFGCRGLISLLPNDQSRCNNFPSNNRDGVCPATQQNIYIYIHTSTQFELRSPSRGAGHRHPLRHFGWHLTSALFFFASHAARSRSSRTVFCLTFGALSIDGSVREDTAQFQCVAHGLHRIRFRTGPADVLVGIQFDLAILNLIVFFFCICIFPFLGEKQNNRRMRNSVESNVLKQQRKPFGIFLQFDWIFFYFYFYFFLYLVRFFAICDVVNFFSAHKTKATQHYDWIDNKSMNCSDLVIICLMNFMVSVNLCRNFWHMNSMI